MEKLIILCNIAKNWLKFVHSDDVIKNPNDFENNVFQWL